MKRTLCTIILLVLFCKTKADIVSLKKSVIFCSTEAADVGTCKKTDEVSIYSAHRLKITAALPLIKVTQHLKKRKQRGLKPPVYSVDRVLSKYINGFNNIRTELFSFTTSSIAFFDIHKRGPPQA